MIRKCPSCGFRLCYCWYVLAWLLAVLSLVWSSQPARAREIKVARVIDGDTLVTTSGERVRLLGVDAPEPKQTYGEQAKAVLMRAATSGTMTIIRERKGAYGRTDAVLTLNTGLEVLNVNENLLLHGHVWLSRDYCPRALLRRYEGLEERARNAHRGLWIIDQPMAPWDFRRRVASDIVKQDIPRQVAAVSRAAPAVSPLPVRLFPTFPQAYRLPPEYCPGGT